MEPPPPALFRSQRGRSLAWLAHGEIEGDSRLAADEQQVKKEQQKVLPNFDCNLDENWWMGRRQASQSSQVLEPRVWFTWESFDESLVPPATSSIKPASRCEAKQGREGSGRSLRSSSHQPLIFLYPPASSFCSSLSLVLLADYHLREEEIQCSALAHVAYLCPSTP